MKLWKIEITAARYYRGVERPYTYTGTGTGTSIEIAQRKMRRQATRDNLKHVKIQSVECLGDKEF